MNQEILEQEELNQEVDTQETEAINDENKENQEQTDEGAENKMENEIKAPETYDFKSIELPEGIQFDNELASKFEPVARELNLTQEDANKLVNMLVEHQKEQLGNQKEIIAQFKKQELEATKIEYQRLLETDNEISGKGKEQYDAYLNLADKGYSAFASDELQSVISQYGLDYHPAVIKHFYRLGKMCGQDNIQNPQTPAGEKQSAAEILYGNSEKQ